MTSLTRRHVLASAAAIAAVAAMPAAAAIAAAERAPSTARMGPDHPDFDFYAFLREEIDRNRLPEAA